MGIKECLFCGQKMSLVFMTKGNLVKYWVECRLCEMRGPTQYSEAGAIFEWNKLFKKGRSQ